MSNRSGVILDTKHHSDWIVPRRVMCAFFWVGIILLFTGIILLVTSQHHGGSVYKSWGSILLGLGFCLLLICLILCLHAYCVISVAEEDYARKRNIAPPPPHHSMHNGHSQVKLQAPPSTRTPPAEFTEHLSRASEKDTCQNNGVRGHLRSVSPKSTTSSELVTSSGEGPDRETSFTISPPTSNYDFHSANVKDVPVDVEYADNVHANPALRANGYLPHSSRSHSLSDPWLSQQGHGRTRSGDGDRTASKGLVHSKTEPNRSIPNSTYISFESSSSMDNKHGEGDATLSNSSNKNLSDLLTVLSSSAAGADRNIAAQSTSCSPFPNSLPASATSGSSRPHRGPSQSPARVSKPSRWYLNEEDEDSTMSCSPHATFINTPPRDSRISHPRPTRQSSLQSETSSASKTRLPKKLSQQAIVYIANPDIQVADSKVTVYDNVHYVPYTQGSRTFCDI